MWRFRGYTPGAPPIVALVAAVAHEQTGNRPGAQRWISRATAANPGLTRDRFFRSIPFLDPELRAKITDDLRRAGLE